MADITMPQLGETVTEGTITRWFKQVGDRVDEDEPLFEVSTDKVDSEVPASAAGYLSEILVKEGDTVDVGVRLAVISDEAPSGGGSPSAERQTGAEPEAEAPPQEPEAEAPPPQAEAEAPPAQPEREARPDAVPAESNGEPARPAGSTSGRLLSPLVRRLLKEHELDPGDIRGTGVDGRVTRADVMAHLDRRPKSPPTAAATAVAATAAPKPRARTGDEVVPFSNIRRRTAEHMVRSQATSAHVLVAAEVDFANVDKVRLAERERFKAEEGFSLTYLPFVCRAVVDAIADFPHVNASVGDDELIVHHTVNLGIAVDLDFEGLIVPVVQGADSKRLRPIARDIADLAARARSRKLNADEISGSTFTITNPGSFGTFLTAPVINQPQVAILSTDGVRKRPVVVALPDGSDGIAVHPVGMVGLSFDHRAFDGAYASAFLARCREVLETRDWSAEL